ncbi:hypothetical protein KEM54_001646 [Ascosphaera aggregata]|nr:hypothetical protein KEM54_001646 [Ascosphaera aggregata]
MSESPLVGWGIYQACFAGIYAVKFGLLDAKKNLGPGSGKYSGFASDVCKAIEILADMRPRLKMAETWFRTLHRLHSYYCHIQKELPIGYQYFGNGEEITAMEQVLVRFGCSEDTLQASNAAAMETVGDTATASCVTLEDGKLMHAAQASKSTPSTITVQPDGSCNLSDLATLAGTREPFATGSNSASSNNRSIAPLIPLAAAPGAVSQELPAQAVGAENPQVERTWGGIAPVSQSESTPSSTNHVYTLPPLQPSLCAVTQAPTSSSLLHGSSVATVHSAVASSFPPANLIVPPAGSVSNVPTMAIPMATTEADEVKGSQSNTSMVIQGQPASPTIATRLQPLTSWVPASSVSATPSLPPILKSTIGPTPVLGYPATAPVSRNEASTSSQPGHAISSYSSSTTIGETAPASGRQLNTPPGMGLPPPSNIQQSPQRPNLLPPIASTNYSHGPPTAQAQPAVQTRHRAAATPLSNAPPVALNISLPRTTGPGSLLTFKPFGVLQDDSILSLDLGGDDALAFFEGAGWELFAPHLASKKPIDGSGQYSVGANGMSRAWLGGSQGLPSGWLALIWADTATS